jgi:hypothetical protein
MAAAARAAEGMATAEEVTADTGSVLALGDGDGGGNNDRGELCPGGGDDTAGVAVGGGGEVGRTVGTVCAWVGCARGTGAFFIGGRVGAGCGLAVGRGFGFGFSTAARKRIVSTAELPKQSIHDHSQGVAPNEPLLAVAR